jgi:hypothetical protein
MSPRHDFVCEAGATRRAPSSAGVSCSATKAVIVVALPKCISTSLCSRCARAPACAMIAPSSVTVAPSGTS